MAMFEVSAAKAKEIGDTIERYKGKLEKVQQKAEETAGRMLAAGVTVGSAFAGAYLHGRYSEVDESTGKPTEQDKWHVANVPADLLGGAALVVGSLAGVLGKYSDLGAAAGSGLLASNLGITGYKMGRTAKATEDKTTLTDTFAPTAGIPQHVTGRRPDSAIADAIRASRVSR